MCTCIKDIEEKVKEQFNSVKKENETIKTVHFIDKALFFDGKTPQSTYSVVEVDYQRNCKSGRIQNKKKNYNMLHKFCPFCGEKHLKS